MDSQKENRGNGERDKNFESKAETPSELEDSGNQASAEVLDPAQRAEEIAKINSQIEQEQEALNAARAVFGLPATDDSLAIRSLRQQLGALQGAPEMSAGREEARFWQTSFKFFQEREALTREADNPEDADRYAEALKQLRKFKDGITQGSDRAELLSLLTDEIREGITYQNSTRETISDELRPLMDDRFAQAEHIFMELSGRMFPDIAAQGSPEAALRNVRSNLRSSGVKSPLDEWMGEARSQIELSGKLVPATNRELAEPGARLQALVWQGALGIEAARRQPPSQEIKGDIVSVARAIYGLKLTEQKFESKTQNKTESAASVEERDTPNAAREEIREISFAEAQDRLKNVTTIEQARVAVTPEIEKAALTFALKGIDDSIAQAVHLNARLNKETTALMLGPGMNGNDAMVYQKIAMAKLGRTPSAAEIASMSPVEFMKQYLKYDLGADTARASELRRRTNAFG